MRTLLIFSLICLCAISFAEDAKDIFSGDSVFDLFDKSQKGKTTSSKKQIPTEKDSNEEIKPKDKVPENIFEEEENQNTLPVQWVGLIINAMDEKHFYKNLDIFLDSMQEYDLDIDKVYALGPDNYTSELSQRTLKITARGGSFRFASNIPEDYGNIETSPAWIVKTTQGIFILEGLQNFKRYFTKHGKLIVSLM